MKISILLFFIVTLFTVSACSNDLNKVDSRKKKLEKKKRKDPTDCPKLDC